MKRGESIARDLVAFFQDLTEKCRKSLGGHTGYHMLATKTLMMHAGESIIWQIYLYCMLTIGIPMSKLPPGNV